MDNVENMLTISIPVYNEGDNIRAELEAIHHDLTVPCIINLVYDFEEDTTLPPARETARNLGLNLVPIRNKYGRGVLNAIKTGLESATTKYVIVTMADLCDPPAVINAMVAAAEQQHADIVCASRYMRGGKQLGGPWLKGRMSRAAGLSLNWLCGLPTHDPTNSFKLYRKSFIDTIKIESDGGFEIGIELVVKAFLRHCIICEVPTTWTDRVAGQSNFKLRKWLPKYLKWYFMAFKHRKRPGNGDDIR